MKRLFFGLMSILLLCSACSKGQPDTPSINRPDFLTEMNLEEHMDISIGYWNIQNMVDAGSPDGMEAYIQDLLNITIQPLSVNWDDYKERYQMLSATASLPDVFATLTLSSSDANDSALLEEFIESGVIRSLPEDLSRWPRLQSLLESVSYTRYSDGKYYAIPRFSFTEDILGSTDAAMIVRRDWMENLGLDNPSSLDEFIELVVAFAKDDPDGNGIDDTLGYNVNNLVALGKWVMLGIAPDCNVFTWIEQDGKYIPSWLTEDFRQVILAYRNLYTSGGLDPDFYTKKATDALEDFAAGRLGALEYKSSASSLHELEVKWKQYNDLPFEECVDVLHIFPAGDGNCYSNSSNIFWSESLISAAVSDEKLERILCLYEYLLSDEGTQLYRYGLEGEDYSYDENGDYQCLLALDNGSLISAFQKKYPSSILFAGITTWGGNWSDFDVNEMNSLRYGRHCIELAAKDVLWNQENTVQLTRPYRFILNHKEPSNTFSTSNMFNDFITVILGEEDPLKMWDEILARYESQGLSAYIERQNEMYQNSVKE